MYRKLIQSPESTNEQEYVEEVKQWLQNLNPAFLCIYFTNDWNPIAKKAELNYHHFSQKNSRYIHLKINSDIYPKLRWFFDAKVNRH
jgi:hypothetical protein